MMIEKLARAFNKLRGEVQALHQRIDALPEPQPGRDGVSPKAEDIAALVLEQVPTPKDGVSPKAEDIAALVLEQIPTPKDGKDADTQTIIREVLAQIPTPKDGKDGKDAQPPLLSDVAEIIMARLPKPKDGKDGKSPTAQEVAAVMPPAQPGRQGKDGKDGASITDVKLDRNILFVWIDGIKKRAGKIDLPQMAAPPTIGGGGGVAELRQQLKRTRPVYGTMAITQRDTNDTNPINSVVVAAHPSGTDVLNPPAAPVVAGPGPFGGYYKMPGYIQEGIAKEITFGDSELIAPNDGVFIIPVGWGNFRHSLNNATVAFVLGIERDGQIIFSPRPTGGLRPTGERLGNVSGGGQTSLKKGDKISVWVASNLAGTITLGNSNVTIHMLEDTSI